MRKSALLFLLAVWLAIPFSALFVISNGNAYGAIRLLYETFDSQSTTLSCGGSGTPQCSVPCGTFPFTYQEDNFDAGAGYSMDVDSSGDCGWGVTRSKHVYSGALSTTTGKHYISLWFRNVDFDSAVGYANKTGRSRRTTDSNWDDVHMEWHYEKQGSGLFTFYFAKAAPIPPGNTDFTRYTGWNNADHNWHHLEIFYQYDNPVASGNGIVRCWIDNTLYIEDTAVQLNKIGYVDYDAFHFVSNFASSATGNYRIDEVEVYDDMPGCDGPEDCNDSNPCTDDTCSAPNCVHTNNSSACTSDSNECTTDICSGGACTHPAVANGTDCTTDGNVCTNDTCQSGSCAHTNNTAACDDALWCNGTDLCYLGSCGHTGNPCSGGSECADNCVEALDNCYETVGTACTADSNECTNDQCDGAGACTHPNKTNGTTCTTDGNLCTIDQCLSGVCSHTPTSGACDDGVFCNGADSCGTGTCSTHTGNPCSGGGECADNCNESLDNCYEANGTSCTSDANTCTSDQCNSVGVCTHPSVTDGTACTTDGNACTTDQCLTGTCSHTPFTGSCNDGLFCNGADTCGGGTCSIHVGDPCHPTCETCDEFSDYCQITLDADIDGEFDANCSGGTDCDDTNPNVNTGETEGPQGHATCTDVLDNDCNGKTDAADGKCGSCAHIYIVPR